MHAAMPARGAGAAVRTVHGTCIKYAGLRRARRGGPHALARACGEGNIHLTPLSRGKGYGLKCPGWWECSLAAISQTTTHMHGHHAATMGLRGWGELGSRAQTRGVHGNYFREFRRSEGRLWDNY